MPVPSETVLEGTPAAAVARGVIDCGPNFGGCWVRIAVFPRPDRSGAEFLSQELPTEVAEPNRLKPLAEPLSLGRQTAGRHLVQVQIVYGSDIGSPPDRGDPRSWMVLCEEVVELGTTPGWTIAIDFREADGCAVAAAS